MKCAVSKNQMDLNKINFLKGKTVIFYECTFFQNFCSRFFNDKKKYCIYFLLNSNFFLPLNMPLMSVVF